MEKGRLLVPKKSNCRIAAIACTVLSLVTGVFTMLGSALLAVVGNIGSAMSDEIKTAIIILTALSLLMTAQAAYALYGVLVSHRTLKHIGIAWVVYPAVTLLGKLGTIYTSYVKVLGAGSDDIMTSVTAAGLVINAVIMLAGLAIGIVLLMYANGRLSDNRILLYLSGGVYLFAVTAGSLQSIGNFTRTGEHSAIMAVAAVTSILITLGSNFVTYAPPFFMAIAMKRSSQ